MEIHVIIFSTTTFSHLVAQGAHSHVNFFHVVWGLRTIRCLLLSGNNRRPSIGRLLFSGNMGRPNSQDRLQRAKGSERAVHCCPRERKYLFKRFSFSSALQFFKCTAVFQASFSISSSRHLFIFTTFKLSPYEVIKRMMKTMGE